MPAGPVPDGGTDEILPRAVQFYNSDGRCRRCVYTCSRTCRSRSALPAAVPYSCTGPRYCTGTAPSLSIGGRVVRLSCAYNRLQDTLVRALVLRWRKTCGLEESHSVPWV